MSYIIDKLRDLYEQTIEGDLKYTGNFKNMDYYSLFCQAAAKKKIYKLMGNNLCMFNCEYNNKDAVMILFSIPLNATEETGSKSVSERTMEVVENMERCFIELDKTYAQEVKEDKFMYLMFIKIVGE